MGDKTREKKRTIQDYSLRMLHICLSNYIVLPNNSLKGSLRRERKRGRSCTSIRSVMHVAETLSFTQFDNDEELCEFVALQAAPSFVRISGVFLRFSRL